MVNGAGSWKGWNLGLNVIRGLGLESWRAAIKVEEGGMRRFCTDVLKKGITRKYG